MDIWFCRSYSPIPITAKYFFFVMIRAYYSRTYKLCSNNLPSISSEFCTITKFITEDI
jgi:hypothetical protein